MKLRKERAHLRPFLFWLIQVGACGDPRTRTPLYLDAGAEARDCDGEPEFGGDADEVARKYAISSSLLYVVATAASPGRPDQCRCSPLDGREPASPPVAGFPPPQSSRLDGLIESVLPSGVLVRVDAELDGRALRRVLGALDDR
jgi:hypothetical protein